MYIEYPTELKSPTEILCKTLQVNGTSAEGLTKYIKNTSKNLEKNWELRHKLKNAYHDLVDTEEQDVDVDDLVLQEVFGYEPKSTWKAHVRRRNLHRYAS